MRTNGFCSHSSPIVEGSRWPGWIRVSGGSFISLSITERLQVGEAGRARRAGAADRALEEDVGGQHVGAVEGERAVVGAVAGRVHDLDPQVAGLDHVAVGERLVDLLVDQLGR